MEKMIYNERYEKCWPISFIFPQYCSEKVEKYKYETMYFYDLRVTYGFI